MNMRKTIEGAALGTLLASVALLAGCLHVGWSDEEKEILRDLRLTGAPPPTDPSNRYADDEGAARLGHKLFFDTRFSSNGAVACATCHVPTKDFQDGLALGKGVGTTGRRTMPITGIAAAPWLFWDGRKDSLWSQALGPLESGVEHGGDRVQYARLVAETYRDEYQAVFGSLPDVARLPPHGSPAVTDERWDAWRQIPEPERRAVNQVFANVGKAIAAYERHLQPGRSRFDRYADAVLDGNEAAAAAVLDRDEVAGLRLFIGKAQCTRCHNGPRFTNDDFANTGVVQSGHDWDVGRELGAREALQDEFNCLGPYSDARPDQCRELASLRPEGGHGLRAFKVPSLRNVAARAPYMHAGQVATLDQVIEHYDRAPRAPAGHSELEPLHLTRRERQQLVRFLGALSAPVDADAAWLSNPTISIASKEQGR